MSLFRKFKKLLKENNTFEYNHLVIKSPDTVSFYIKPCQDEVKHLKLLIQEKNLYNGQFVQGYLSNRDSKLHKAKSSNYRTTQWFPVLPLKGKSLVLSGTAHNRSVWQFKTADEVILPCNYVSPDFNAKTNVSPDRTFSKIDIPENAAYARVFFACLSDPDSECLDERLQIEYGKIPTSYEQFHMNEILLPSCEAECTISYENGTWYMNKDNDKTPLTLPSIGMSVGCTLSVISDSPIEFEVSYTNLTPKKKATGIYGIRYNTKDRNPVCERVGDAKGLHFNATVDNDNLTPYANDFDHIYPWSDIRICAVLEDSNGERKITYKSSKEFKRDGSVGDVMVEIPKFYTKREIIDDYDYLWISGKPADGFVLDPSFITKDGELEHIYIAAYHSSLQKKMLTSTHKSYPVAKLSLKKIHELIPKESSIKECDLLMILTIQRLFLVETALLDSQSLFTGNVVLPYMLNDKTTSCYAMKSENATNHIFVRDTNVTRRFRVGDSISILNNWKEYRNIPKKFQRQITDIIELKNRMLEIHFTGSPIDIVEHETGITCIPCKNGKTNGIKYHTGAVLGTPGHYSFKYRHIENLWGNISIFLDSCFVLNNELYITYPTGETKKIDIPLPIQKVQLSAKQFGNPTDIVVKKMGFDPENPLIMFPCEIGNGALINTFYCDAWYNSGEPDVTYVLTYGGAWDNKGYAGIFNFRASFTEDSLLPYNGSRLMMR